MLRSRHTPLSRSSQCVESHAPPSSSGGGGGGGSAITVTPKVTRIVAAIAEGNNLIEFTESEKVSVGVEEILLDSATAASNVKLTIEKLTAMPAGIVSFPSGDVYSYLQFNKTVLKDEDVKNAKIRFTVKKEWIVSKGSAPDKIKLNRYTTKWEALPTQYLRQNGTYYYYEATTPGFSVFAVTAEKKEQAEKPTSITKQENITKEEAPLPTEAPAEQEKPRQRQISYVFLVLIVITIITLIIIFGLKRKKNLKK